MRSEVRPLLFLRRVWFVPLFLLGCKDPLYEAQYAPLPSYQRTVRRPPRPQWMLYDAALADAVHARWYQLMNQRPTAIDSGRVILEFQLHADGSIDDLFVSDNTEGEVLSAICQKALLDPMPYNPWPLSMQKLFGDTRRFRMSFEFDALGVGYLDYAEDWVELARQDKPPAETTIVLGYCRGKPPGSILKNQVTPRT